MDFTRTRPQSTLRSNRDGLPQALNRPSWRKAIPLAGRRKAYTLPFRVPDVQHAVGNGVGRDAIEVALESDQTSSPVPATSTLRFPSADSAIRKPLSTVGDRKAESVFLPTPCETASCGVHGVEHTGLRPDEHHAFGNYRRVGDETVAT